MKSKVISKLPYITNKAISLIRNDLPVFSFFASSSIASFKNIVINPRLNTSAWTIFLQSSLILSIWNNFDYFKKLSFQDFYKSNITILIAFIFGSIGSVIGSILGYYTSILYVKLTNNNVILTSHISLQLKLIASCICSSYIGGSANYFETAELLTSKLMTSHVSTNTILLKNGLNAVAGIDIAIMVLYFTVITSIQSAAASRRRSNNNYNDNNKVISVIDMGKLSTTKYISDSNMLSTNSTIIASSQGDIANTSATTSTGTTVTTSTAESDPATTTDLKAPNQTSKTTSSLRPLSLSPFKLSAATHLIRHILTSSLTYIFPLTSAVCICYISQYIQTNILTTPGISVLSSTILSLLTASFYSVFSHYFTNRTQFNLSEYTVNLEVACGNLSSSMLTAFYILLGKLYVCITI